MKTFKDDKPLTRYSLFIIGTVIVWLLGSISTGLLAAYIYSRFIKG